LAIASSFSIRFVVFDSPYPGGMIAFLSRPSNFTEIMGMIIIGAYVPWLA